MSVKTLMRAGLAAIAGLVLAGAGSADAQPGRGADRPIEIVALGDSLTAGYQLPPGAAFPARLEAALKARGYNVRVVNAGVSGDTASDGLARVDWSVDREADAVIVELGANDMLRGIDPAATHAALDRLLGRLNQRGLPILLAGMYAAPNLGADYGLRFNRIYPDLAKKHGAILYPFFLDGVATHPELTLPDGMHPNAEGIQVIVERILPSVQSLIERVRAVNRPEPGQ